MRRAEERHALDAELLSRLEGVGPLIAGLLLILALTKPWTEAAAGFEGVLVLAGVDILALIGFLGVRALIRAHRVAPRHANAASAFLLGLLVVNATTHALVLEKPPEAEAVTYVLVMIAAAVFLTRASWFVAIDLAVVAAWLAGATLVTDDALGVLGRIGVHIGTAASAAGIIFVIHSRTLLRAHRNHELAEARARRAEALAEDLRTTGRELEAFAYTAAHDLRAPLRAIKAHTEALDEHAADLRTDDRHHLTRISRESERLGVLVQDLLELAHTGRGALGVERVDVSAMAREVADALRDADATRRVDVRVADGLVADADPALLRSILENLIGNAWKFTRMSAEAAIEVGATDTRYGRAIYVRDNGIGFPQAEARLLFRPFRRLASAAAFEGTGVGLASVERAVRRHGGHVWAEAKPGMGATFFFTLAPPSRAPDPLAEPEPERVHASRGRRASRARHG